MTLEQEPEHDKQLLQFLEKAHFTQTLLYANKANSPDEILLNFHHAVENLDLEKILQITNSISTNFGHFFKRQSKEKGDIITQAISLAFASVGAEIVEFSDPENRLEITLKIINLISKKYTTLFKEIPDETNFAYAAVCSILLYAIYSIKDK